MTKNCAFYCHATLLREEVTEGGTEGGMDGWMNEVRVLRCVTPPPPGVL